MVTLPYVGPLSWSPFFQNPPCMGFPQAATLQAHLQHSSIHQAHPSGTAPAAAPPSSSSAQHIGSMCSSCHMFAAQQRKGAPRSAESTHETLQRTLTLPSPTARVILSLSIIQCIKLENSKQLQKEDLLAAQQFKWPAPPYSMCSYGDIRKKSVSIATKIGSEP